MKEPEGNMELNYIISQSASLCQELSTGLLYPYFIGFLGYFVL